MEASGLTSKTSPGRILSLGSGKGRILRGGQVLTAEQIDCKSRKILDVRERL
jgi:hypothetical protein